MDFDFPKMITGKGDAFAETVGFSEVNRHNNKITAVSGQRSVSNSFVQVKQTQFDDQVEYPW
jgi:hypothetical protein